MKVRISANKPGLDKTCHDILRALLGDIIIVAASPEEEPKPDELNLAIMAEEGKILSSEVRGMYKGITVVEKAIEEILVSGEEPNQIKRLSKLAVYKVLLEILHLEPLPWGILTGIRPTKIVHRLFDIGWNKEIIEKHLTGSYGMSMQKATGLFRVADNNRKYLLERQEAREKVSVYIGIPFCPTRCAYCSFPAYPVKKKSDLMAAFLKALGEEIRIMGSLLRERGLKVQTLYIGGGTPTTLDAGHLARLFEIINQKLLDTETEEITLEAGRPDTIDVEKLKVSKEAGVTRLSINPQSMNSDTLKIIGRHHSPEQVKKAFEDARYVGFNNINMDLIVGLPGENCSAVELTLKEVGELCPENLTVHTMAVKKASTIRENIDKYPLPEEHEVTKMLALTEKFAEESGMVPYYLYRQKYMVGPMENKGYAFKGLECIYNIQVIEERQTILGLGAGAASKFVNPDDWTLTSVYNPKDPQMYIERVQEIANKKAKYLCR